MKIALYARPDNVHLPSMERLLNLRSIDYLLNATDTTLCTHAISLGGDGTFLSAVRKMGLSRRLPLLGINGGRLGFLATVNLEDMELALDSLIAGKYHSEKRTMIEIEGIDICGASKSRALNEFTIQKHGPSMIEIELSIDDALVASYWADGVIVSTPTGSTAYSMSVSGSILAPDCQCFIISPIAPHNLSLRPLVVSDCSSVAIRVVSRTGKPSICTVDNREYEAPSGSTYTISKSPESQQVIGLVEGNFYDTLREKLLWGVDLRN